MSSVELLRIVLGMQVGLAVAAFGLWTVPRSARASAVVAGSRVLLVAALGLPLVVSVMPRGSAELAPAQVWSEPGWRATEKWPATRGEGTEIEAMGRSVEVGPAISAAGWLAAVGVGIGLFVGLVEIGRIRHAVRSATELRRIGSVRVVVSDAVDSPWCVWWPGRSTIVLDARTALNADLRVVAIRHEAVHLRNRDAAWAWALVGARMLACGSPVASAYRRAAVHWEELACDASVVRSGIAPTRYARALVEAASPAVLHATRGLSSKSALATRVDRLLDPPADRLPWRLGAVAVLAIVSLGLAMAAVVEHRVSESAVVAARAKLSPEFAVVDPLIDDELRGLVGSPAGRGWMVDGLAHRPQWQDLVDGGLQARGMPIELAVVPLVESGYHNLGGPGEPVPGPNVPGAGLWMFIRPTAAEYGMSPEDRVDPVRETAAALDLLTDLHERYGDWGLALAAYNQGPARVDAAIEAEGTRDVWTLARSGALNRYVPMTYAAMLVMVEPGLL